MSEERVIIKLDMKNLTVSVKGIVQGVGFRPFVYNLARELSLKGFVTNTSDGVSLVIEGEALGTFVERLRSEAPPLSRIMELTVEPGEFRGFEDFSIKRSEETGSFTLLSPDISICGDCLRELFDAKDRRFLYPFINCTNCGPRYSITESVPYDRPNTTMKVFRMCGRCEAEYRDPGNRRFHAQPNACPECGPRLTLLDSDGGEIPGSNPLSAAAELLERGRVLAIKGLGGFHLACDATNREAVDRLRTAKRRSNKPFGLMAPDAAAVRGFCHVSAEEDLLLNSPERPIVLLRKKAGVCLSESVAPNNAFTGFMLPCTPLHYALFYCPDGAHAFPHKPRFSALVMTSGNLSEEPIVTDNDEAVRKLSGMVDAFLMHDRQIFMRVDDSVVRVPEGRPAGRGKMAFIRRSRGYVPYPILLRDDGPDVLGCGGELKNTFTLTRGRYAIPSQHVGDMENYETLLFFEETLRNLKSVYRAKPEALACDPHPRYLATQWALSKGRQSEGGQLPVYAIQHHYAHVTSVMAEKGLKEKVIGVAFDGTGYGDDGALWGGEFFIADIMGYERAGHLGYVSLPGGEAAIRHPWRIAVSYLKALPSERFWRGMMQSGFTGRYGRQEIETILRISERADFSPLSSGAGRLFDAVSALLGICDRNTFEGEAAIALEAMAAEGIDEQYHYECRSGRGPLQIDFGVTFSGILEDLERGADRRVMAAKFHNAVSSSIVTVTGRLAAEKGIRKVVLSGGVFQNSYLLKRVEGALAGEGLSVFTNELVPCNDAGISLGQAYVARERLKAGMMPGEEPAQG